MKFVFFVEGHTEKKALPDFLRRWLDSKLPQRVGVQVVRFEGWAELVNDLPRKAPLYLANEDVIAVVALLDLYGPTFYPANAKTAEKRHAWAVKHLESKVNDKRFKSSFAVHETEAWLLSKPDLFPTVVTKALPGKIDRPEEVNFDEPPAKLLDRVYKEKTGRGYKKVTYGRELFAKLDPALARERCPYLRECWTSW